MEQQFIPVQGEKYKIQHTTQRLVGDQMFPLSILPGSASVYICALHLRRFADGALYCFVLQFSFYKIYSNCELQV